MKKSGHIVCVLAAIALLYGCEWNSSLYEKYVNEEEGGTVASCHGACGGEITEENCRKVNGNWISGKCDGVDAGDTALTKLQCREKGGLWYDAYCQVNINDIDTCKNAGGVWGQYTMLDLGAGIYIRKIESDDQPARYICGSYTLVINDDPNASTCSDEQLETFNQALEYQLCPKGKSCQLAYQKTEAADDAVAICSSCPQNNVMCRNADQSFSCTNLDNDPKNCGACGAFCESDYTCIEGICVYSKVKVCDSKLVQCGAEPNGDPLCYDPSTEEFCGAVCNENGKLDFKKCDNNFVCKPDSKGGYRCVCESEIIIDKDSDGKTVQYCVDPKSDEHCGATLINKEGHTCHLGTRCADVGGVLRCTCALSWVLPCYYDDGVNVDCIDPKYNMQYCGAEACTDAERELRACSSSEVCFDGECICRDGYVKCGDECINPLNNNIYCGASGACNSEISGEDFIGESCSDYKICKNGQCVCMEGYVDCNGHCVHPSEVEKCGAKIENDICVFTDCTKLGALCKLISDDTGYGCTCPVGQVMCDGKCIDPMANTNYCGATNDCSVANKTNGERCPSDRPICYEGKCLLHCPGEQEACNKTCVSFKSDINNCGACERKCEFKNGISTCLNGECSLVGCASGFEDCDKNPDNGCEIDIKANLNNCGACGNKCEFAHASAKCVDEKCQIDECEIGFSDCDGNLQNGCEQDLMTDLSACGKCDAVCSRKNAVSVCDSGVCKMSDNACYNGFGDCDGNEATGCEIKLDSIEHCGACGNKCVFEYASSKCDSGVCHIDTCNANYGNCDKLEENGCESSLTTDVNNCGACDRKCTGSYQNATDICSAGECKMKCNDGYSDCDSKNNNGCEAHLNTDGQNCGKCGNACTGTYNNATSGCNNGKCEMICNAGYGNCDNRADNGCEKNITNDKNNCGECRLKCDSKYSCGSSNDAFHKCSLACESGTCCVSGRLSKNDTNGDNVVCCSGYELYKYTKIDGRNSPCSDSTRRGCYKSDPDGQKTCWQKVK